MSALARTVMALASETLAAERPEWAAAMTAEFEASVEDGRALTFALGCLVATWHARLKLPFGRFAAVRSLFAVVAILPFAAFHLGCGVVAIRFLLGAPNGYYQALLHGDATARATAAIYPPLTAILILPVLVLGAAHMVFAWNLIEWRPRHMLVAAGIATLAAAAMALTIVLLMPRPTGVALQFAAIGVEAVAFTVFFTWRTRLEARRAPLGELPC